MTDDRLLPSLRYLAHDAPEYGTRAELRLKTSAVIDYRIIEQVSNPHEEINGRDSDTHYAQLCLPPSARGAVDAITDGRLDAFLVANPRPRVDWSIPAYKPPRHPLDGIRFNLAEQA